MVLASWCAGVLMVAYGVLLMRHSSEIEGLVWLGLASLPFAFVLYQPLRLLVQIRAVVRLLYDRYLEIATDDSLRNILQQPRYSEPGRLNRFESKVFSQGGEDGIIKEIFRRIGLRGQGYFVEFGAADGFENNTVLLLKTGWRGLWFEWSPMLVQKIKTCFDSELKTGMLTVCRAFITAETIESLFAKAGVPIDFDLLSIDIDRNDYHVWKSIRGYRPKTVVIEYNSTFPPGVDWVVAYDSAASFDNTSNFGASLTALENLGKEMGYSLVGCTLGGVNAFFVRNDLVGDRFAAPFTAQNHYEPPRYHLVLGRLAGHPRRP